MVLNCRDRLMGGFFSFLRNDSKSYKAFIHNCLPQCPRNQMEGHCHGGCTCCPLSTWGGPSRPSAPLGLPPLRAAGSPCPCKRGGGVKHGGWWAGHWAEAEQCVQRADVVLCGDPSSPSFPALSPPSAPCWAAQKWPGPQIPPGLGLFPSLLLHPTPSAFWRRACSRVATAIHGHREGVHLQAEETAVLCLHALQPPAGLPPSCPLNQDLQA